MRTPLIAGNWKMYKTPAQAKHFVFTLLPRLHVANRVEVGLSPPFLALPAVVEAVKGSEVEVFAQNLHHAPEGASTPEQAQEAISFVRALVADCPPDQAEVVRILYGGSVNADNAGELLALPDVDGAFVGGASLDPESFATIVESVR